MSHMRYNCLINNRGLCFCDHIPTTTTGAHSWKLFLPMPTAMIYHWKYIVVAFATQQTPAPTITFDSAMHYHYLCVDPHYQGVLSQISRKPPPNGLNNTFQIAKKEVHNFGRLRSNRGGLAFYLKSSKCCASGAQAPAKKKTLDHLLKSDNDGAMRTLG